MNYDKFAELTPCDYAGPLKRESFMDYNIKELWNDIPTISGPAFTVNMAPGDNLAMHKAIYEAPKGSIIVAQTNSMQYAVTGGNVSLIAKNLGIKGFIIDGLVRDIGEVKEMKFPIFGRGVHPMPGTKKAIMPLNTPITAGGALVNPGDIIVANEEGVVVIPKDKAEDIYNQTKQNIEKEKAMGFEKWAANHKAKIHSFYE